MGKYVIFAGRFQPFHAGHMAVCKGALDYIASDDVLILAAIAPTDAALISVDSSFSKTAAEHHTSERNPWSLPVRLGALHRVASCLEKDFAAGSIVVTAIPRPDFGWSMIELWFPKPREWIIPLAEEAFDDSKAVFFERMGDDVLRIEDLTKVSGRQLRDLWSEGLIKNMKQHMPECVHSCYFRR